MGTLSFGGTRARHGVSRRPGMWAVTGLVLALAGAAILFTLPWQQAIIHLKASSWPSAQARIVSASLVEEHYAEPGSDAFSTGLVLSVTYEFEVAGQTYTGYAASLDDRAAAHDRRLQTLYRRLVFAKVTGRSVPVFHDPHEPEHAYLDTAFPAGPTVWRGGLGLACLLVGLGLLVAPLRASNRRD